MFLQNLEINKSTKNFPGPGKYKDISVLETKGFKWTIPQDGRFTKIKPRNTKLVRLKVPGPGSYNIKNLIGREGPKYTFNKVKFNHSDEVDESMKEKTLKYPSPTTYLQRIDYVSDLPKYTIPKFDISKFEFFVFFSVMLFFITLFFSMGFTPKIKCNTNKIYFS